MRYMPYCHRVYFIRLRSSYCHCIIAVSCLLHYIWMDTCMHYGYMHGTMTHVPLLCSVHCSPPYTAAIMLYCCALFTNVNRSTATLYTLICCIATSYEILTVCYIATLPALFTVCCTTEFWHLSSACCISSLCAVSYTCTFYRNALLPIMLYF